MNGVSNNYKTRQSVTSSSDIYHNKHFFGRENSRKICKCQPNKLGEIRNQSALFLKINSNLLIF